MAFAPILSECAIVKSPASESSDSSPLAPHPVLKEYYAEADQRQQRVDAMFNASAPHYDWIISVMSFGSGHRYRSEAMHRHGLAEGMQVVDVGSGTGSLALIAQQTVGEQGRVVAVDPSEGMLTEAKRNGVTETLVATGDRMPLDDDQFDLLSMGYALRHVADLKDTFVEYRRVLKSGGKVLLLEITRPKNRIGFHLLRFYLRGVVPLMARLFRRSPETQELMRYYWDTIENCVPPESILEALKAAGFKDVQRHVVFGIFSEYTGLA